MMSMFSPTSSLASTPRKRRKITAVTWSVLCKDIPEDQSCVENVLQNGELSAEVFVLIPEVMQRGYLKDCLGEGSASMIELVIKAAKEIKGKPSPELTTVDKVKERLLAPSTELKAEDVVHILNFIFEWDTVEMAGIYRKLRELLEEVTMPTSPQEEPIVKHYARLFKEQRNGTLYIGTKEASGYAQLSDYLLWIRHRMQTLYDITVHVDPQYQIKGNGKIFFADGGLVAMVVNTNSQTEPAPVCVVEYKPRVPGSVEDMDPVYLSELFLQAYYLQRDKQQHHCVLHVLTDLVDFYWFIMRGGKILKFHYTKCFLYEEQDLLKHSDAICSILKEMCSTL